MQVAPVMLDVEQVHLAQLSGAAAALAGPLQLPPAPADAARCRPPCARCLDWRRVKAASVAVLQVCFTVTSLSQRVLSGHVPFSPAHAHPHIGAAWHSPSHVCKMRTQDSLP